MAKKETPPEKKLQKLCAEIADSVRRWNEIRERGCSDPSWPDGVNMNLVRNHIFYFRRQIRDLCAENALEMPEEAMWEPPPEVPDRLFLGDQESARCKRIASFYAAMASPGLMFPDRPLPVYDPCPPGQMSLF